MLLTSIRSNLYESGGLYQRRQFALSEAIAKDATNTGPYKYFHA